MDEDLFNLIEARSTNFTTVEKVIANYFLQHRPLVDINELAQKLYVSKSSITRFCKKIGLANYKELNFLYRLSLREEEKNFESHVLAAYTKLINDSRSVDNVTLDEICQLIKRSKIIHFIGKGFNSFVGRDLQFKFAKLGKYIRVVDDDKSILLTTNLAISNDEVMLFVTRRGRDSSLKEAMTLAQVPVILITANKDSELIELADLVLFAANSEKNFVEGSISPQIPMLIQLDLIYERYAYFYNDIKQNYREIERNFYREE